MVDQALQNVLGLTNMISQIGKGLHGGWEAEAQERDISNIKYQELKTAADRKAKTENYRTFLQNNVDNFYDVDARTPEGRALLMGALKKEYGDKLDMFVADNLMLAQGARNSVVMEKQQEAAKQKLESANYVVGDTLTRLVKGDDSAAKDMTTYLNKEFSNFNVNIEPFTDDKGKKKYKLTYNDILSEDYQKQAATAKNIMEIPISHKTEIHDLPSLTNEIAKKLQNAGPMILKGELARQVNINETNLANWQNRGFYIKNGQIIRGAEKVLKDGETKEFVVQDDITGKFSAIPGTERDFLGGSGFVKIDDKTNAKIQSDIELYRQQVGEPSPEMVQAITMHTIGLTAGKLSKKTGDALALETFKAYGIDAEHMTPEQIAGYMSNIRPAMKDGVPPNKAVVNWMEAGAQARAEQAALPLDQADKYNLDANIKYKFDELNNKSKGDVLPIGAVDTMATPVTSGMNEGMQSWRNRILGKNTSSTTKAPVPGTERYKVTIGKGKAVKNNNPGNIKSSSGEFKKYDTPEAGFQGLIDDIKKKQSGKSSTGLTPDSTLKELIYKYAPPHENDSARYAKFIADQLPGVTQDTPIKYINTEALAKAMAKFESGTKVENIKPKKKPQTLGY